MAVILRVALFIMTIIIGAVPFIVIQKIILRTMPRYEHILPQYFHHLVCWLLGIKITVRGDISTYQPTIFIANHLSWVDIPILGSVLRGHFVAKSEMQSWPIIGWMCHLQRTIFVNRQEKHRSHQQANVIADYLKQKRNIMLFAEGTSSDGNRILPFKSSLLSVRDQRSFDSMRLFGLDAKLVPDSAIIMSDVFTQDFLYSSTHLKTLKDKKYLFLQLGRYKSPSDLKTFVKQLKSIGEQLGLEIVLCPIGLAPGHEDDVVLNKIYKFILK